MPGKVLVRNYLKFTSKTAMLSSENYAGKKH